MPTSNGRVCKANMYLPQYQVEDWLPQASDEGILDIVSEYGRVRIGDSARAGLADSIAHSVLLHIEQLALLLHKEASTD